MIRAPFIIDRPLAQTAHAGGDWKMETDNDYDVANDYLDRIKLVAYTEKMNSIKSLLGIGKKTKKDYYGLSLTSIESGDYIKIAGKIPSS